MKKISWILLVALLVACGSSNTQKEAEELLKKANEFFDRQEYDRALLAIDSLRNLYPNAIDTRKKALTLYQSIELKRTQEELAHVDSMLEAVKHDYDYQKTKVDKDRKELRATESELRMLNMTHARLDSLQNRFDVLCAKIRYIHKKQK